MASDGNLIPDDLRFTVEHEWLRIEEGSARVGISDYAQDQLGDVVYVDLPKLGSQLAAMSKLGEIESVKVASELFSPAAGEVIEINGALDAAPELVNKDPYGEGWLVVIRLSEPDAAEKLLTPEAYADLVLRERGGN